MEKYGWHKSIAFFLHDISNLARQISLFLWKGILYHPWNHSLEINIRYVDDFGMGLIDLGNDVTTDKNFSSYHSFHFWMRVMTCLCSDVHFFWTLSVFDGHAYEVSVRDWPYAFVLLVVDSKDVSLPCFIRFCVKDFDFHNHRVELTEWFFFPQKLDDLFDVELGYMHTHGGNSFVDLCFVFLARFGAIVFPGLQLF